MREDKQKQLIMDYAGTFGTPEGKRTLADLRMRFRTETVFIPNRTGQIDIHEVMLNLGQRSVLVHIDMMRKTDPHKERQTEAK